MFYKNNYYTFIFFEYLLYVYTRMHLHPVARINFVSKVSAYNFASHK